ncbi:CFDP2 [Symbiodinium sp. CCMP2592]|nr:CFDP2 [Symbiodinium sp. CCMP2592]
MALTQPPDSEYHVGEQNELPLTCELLAIVWAITWIIEYGPSYEVGIELRYDCTSAGRGTFADYKVATGAQHASSSELAHFACYLRQLADRRVSLTHAHVPGHSGDVGNELCNELSKYCRRHGMHFTDICLPRWPGQVFRHPLKAWLWLVDQHSGDTPTLFALESESVRLQAQPRLPTHGPQLGSHETERSVNNLVSSMSLASYNVLTLMDPSRPGKNARQEGLKVSAKRCLLKRQLQQLNVLLCGIQETRIVCTEMLPDADFWMIHSAATPAGHHGVALWISRKLPYARCGQHMWYFEKDHCAVTSFSPRHLVVQLNAPYVSWTVLVCHGPSEPPAASGTAAAFWATCRRAVAKRPSHSELIVLTDANAHLGSLSSVAVGDVAPETETAAGTAFHDFLADQDLFLPSTFASSHHGPSHTWVAPSGAGHRLDYIAVPTQWPIEGVKSTVLYQFESLQLSVDHYPVLLQCNLMCRDPEAHFTTFRRRAVRPATTVPTPQYLAALTVARQQPSLQWTAQVDDHFAALTTAWTNASKSLDEPNAPKPRQAYLQPDTLQLVRQRKGVRVALSQTHQELRRRIEYLQGLVRRVAASDIRDPKNLFRAVRKAFPAASSKRRQAFQPIPAIQNAEGELASNRDDRHEVWRSHFAALEDGEPILAEDYPDRFAEQRQAVSLSSGFDIHALATLTAIEQLALGLKRGKACGPDGLTGELLQLAPAATARLLAPLFLKSAMGIQEPLEFRGGCLIPLAKQAHESCIIDMYGAAFVIIYLQSTSKLELSQAAFYRVIRQLVAPVGDDDRSLRKFFHTLGVPPEALQELAGDSLADVFFGFAFAAYLRTSDVALDTIGLSTATPTLKTVPPWGSEIAPPRLGAGAWADDFVHFHRQPQLDHLVSNVLRIVTVYVERSDAIGMQLTFAKDKTAAMLSIQDLSQTGLACVRPGPEGYCIIGQSAVTKLTFELPIVDAYRHLGGIMTSTGTPAPEIAFRSAQAWIPVRPLRTKLFAAPGIPLEVRRHLLRSLAMSRFVFGSAVLRLHVAVHFRAWARAYVALWRSLHRRQQHEKTPHAYETLLRASAPSPPLALALARAALLRQIVHTGPSTLRHLLWHQWEADRDSSWLGQIVKDIKHAALYSPTAETLLSDGRPLHGLIEAILDQPMWWTRLLKGSPVPMSSVSGFFSHA